MQLTPGRWMQDDAAILNKVFNLASERCIWELADPNTADRIERSLLLAAAAHVGKMEKETLPILPTQIEWAAYWARVIKRYNGQQDYGRDIVRTGMEEYAPQ